MATQEGLTVQSACIFCQKEPKASEAFLMAQFYEKAGRGLSPGTAPFHVACFIDMISDVTSQKVVSALEDGSGDASVRGIVSDLVSTTMDEWYRKGRGRR